VANPRFTISHRRLAVAVGLALLAVSACQGPAESQQTGSLAHPHAVIAAHGHAAYAAATVRGARS
jgi:hypothetical protein